MRNRFLAACCALFCIFVAQPYAVAGICGTLSIFHPYGPGGASAGVIRVLAEEIKTRTGATVVVDYRPGAMGVPSARALKDAKPDGCKVGVLAGIHSISPWLMEKPPYDPTKDFVPITHIAQFPNVLVTADERIRTFDDLIRLSKEKPEEIVVGTMSPGSPDFVTGLFLKEAGLPVNVVPYGKEAVQMPVDVQNGTLHIGIQNLFVFLGALQQKTIRAIAVTTKERLKKFGDVPSIFESDLPGFTETKSWFGLYGPPGLAREHVTALNRVVGDILRDQRIVDMFAELGMQSKPSTPEELARIMADEYRLQGDAIRRFHSSQK